MEIVRSRANMEAEISLKAQESLKGPSKAATPVGMRESVTSFRARSDMGISEGCANPICGVELDRVGRPHRKRRFCSDSCRWNYWTLVRAARLLWPLGEKRAVAVLKELANDGP